MKTRNVKFLSMLIITLAHQLIITLVLSVVVMVSLSNQAFSQVQNIPEKDNKIKPVENPYVNAEIEIKTFQNTDEFSGWGYDIYITKTRYIHQPHIPAVNGNKGFSSEKNAKIAAELAVKKIRKNEMPPTISINELDSLGVLK